MLETCVSHGKIQIKIHQLYWHLVSEPGGGGGKPRGGRDFCTFSAPPPLPLAHTHTFNLFKTLNNVKERFSSLLVFTLDSLNLHVQMYTLYLILFVNFFFLIYNFQIFVTLSRILKHHAS